MGQATFSLDIRSRWNFSLWGLEEILRSTCAVNTTNSVKQASELQWLTDHQPACKPNLHPPRRQLAA